MYQHTPDTSNTSVLTLEQSVCAAALRVRVWCAQVSGDARAMRRQMRDRALAGLDKLEVLQRSALSGAPILSVAQSVAGDLPYAPSEAGGAAGAEEEFVYQPTKVCTAGLFLLLSDGSLQDTAGFWVSGPTQVGLGHVHA